MRREAEFPEKAWLSLNRSTSGRQRNVLQEGAAARLAADDVLHELERAFLARRQLEVARAERRDPLAPADHVRAPREPAAEGWCQEDRAGPYPPFLERLDECDRDGRRRHVAVALHGDEHLVHRHPGAFRDGFDDAQVRLVRNDEIDLGGRDAGALQCCFGRVRHAVYRAPEDFLAVEVPAGIAELYA